jgi:hypothetical protein
MRPWENIFLTSKFSYLLFVSIPTHKTKIRIANRWETTNSAQAFHLELSSQSPAPVRLCSHASRLPTSANCAKINSEPNGHVLTCLHPILIFVGSYTEQVCWSCSKVGSCIDESIVYAISRNSLSQLPQVEKPHFSTCLM